MTATGPQFGRFWRRLAQSSGLMALLVAVGCGGRGDISGTVTYKGKNVVWASVQVEGSDGQLKETRIKPDGTYFISSVAAGEAKFAVPSANPKERMILRKSDQPPMTKAPLKAEGWFPLPAEYQEITKPKITFEVKSGANHFDIELK